jgi:predicted ribosome quality control (RQC) complex YloA/Tae2 family protein
MVNNIVIDMKRTVTKFIPSLKKNIVYKIGSDSTKNSQIIDESDNDDLWFHIKNESSCHVIACLKNIQYTFRDDELPNFYDVKFDDLDKKQKLQIVKQGALLCKQYSRFNSLQNVDVIYTKIQNVQKTNIVGKVMVFCNKTITI